jgi:hypothetical protein
MTEKEIVDKLVRLVKIAQSKGATKTVPKSKEPQRGTSQEKSLRHR